MKAFTLLKIIISFSFLVLPLYIIASPDSIIIKGNINNYHQAVNADTTATVELWIQDIVKDDVITFDDTVKPDGSFLICMPLHHAQDVQLKYNSEFLTLFLKPGDELIVNFDGKNIVNTVIFKGNAANLNKGFAAYQYAQQLHLKQTYHSQLEKLRELDAMKKGSPDQFKAFVFERLRKDTIFYNNYIKNHALNDTLRQWAKTEIRYQCANELFRYASFATNVKTLPKSYFDFLQTFPINNDEASISSAYLNYLSYYSNSSLLLNSVEMPFSLICKYILHTSKTLLPKQSARLTKISQKPVTNKPSVFDILFIKKVLDENDGERQDLIADSTQAYFNDHIINTYLKQTEGFAKDALLTAYFYKALNENNDVAYVKNRLNIYNKAVSRSYMRKETEIALNRQEEKLSNYALSSQSEINFVPITPSDSLFSRITERYIKAK